MPISSQSLLATSNWVLPPRDTRDQWNGLDRAITVANDGALSIRNRATVADPSALKPTLLLVSAPNITLTNASITAESTGNVNASDIRIDFTNRLIVDPSRVTTSANQRDGGDIRISG